MGKPKFRKTASKNPQALKSAPTAPERGNTITLSGNQCVWWFFTWNNYSECDVSQMLTFLNAKARTYAFQRETGENGTKHLQGCFQLYSKARWTEFNLSQKIHWEKVVHPLQSLMYCTKNETRDPGTTPYTRGLPAPISVREPSAKWELDILDIIHQPADLRKIYWFWENKGNFGKSSFVKYLVVREKAMPCIGGRLQDICNLVVNQGDREFNIVVFDIPRGHGGHVSYDALECMKNGLIVNTKYEAAFHVFNSPHIIIFANEPPANPEKLSEDRWVITELTN